MPPLAPTDTLDTISGLRKAAILVLSLDRQASAVLLERLPPNEVEEVAREMAHLGEIPRTLRDEVIGEFYQLAATSGWATSGGEKTARQILTECLSKDRADAIMERVGQTIRRQPFAFLAKADSANLLTFIQDEHPQTIALIVSHLSYAKAAEVLAGLPADKQIEVVKRVANMDQTNPEVVAEVEVGLESRLASMLGQSFEQIGGVGSVAEVLNLIDRTTEKGIMDSLNDDDPELVESIRRLMFVFDDVNMVDDAGIQAVLKEVENDQLSLALKTASDELKEKIFGNMSSRAAEMIQEEMQYMGPVRVADVETAQQGIVDIVRRLEDAGEIIIAGRGGDKDLIV